MAEVTHWLEYGEPIGNQRVEAVHRVTYMTGPNEQRDDDVIHGTLTFEGLELFESEEYDTALHDDGLLMLSALEDKKRDTIMAEFEALPEMAQLIVKGCNPAEAVDYQMVEVEGFTQTAWAELTNRVQQTVSENVSKARAKL